MTLEIHMEGDQRVVSGPEEEILILAQQALVHSGAQSSIEEVLLRYRENGAVSVKLTPHYRLHIFPQELRFEHNADDKEYWGKINEQAIFEPAWSAAKKELSGNNSTAYQ